MERPDLERGEYRQNGSQQAQDSPNDERRGSNSKFAQAYTEAGGRSSLHEREPHDDGPIVSPSARFLRDISGLGLEAHVFFELRADGKVSEQPAVAGAQEPVLDWLADSATTRSSHRYDTLDTMPLLDNIGQISKPSRRCCGRHSTCGHGPKVQVSLLEDASIRFESSMRSSLRSDWRNDSSPERLLDPWKAFWRPGGSLCTGIAEWACDDTQRQELQLELIDALTFGRPHPFVDKIMGNDIRVIAGWISLIGIRLNDIYRSAGSNRSDLVPGSAHAISPVTQIVVLIECLWACNGCSNAEVGRILANCYTRKVLKQPSYDDCRDVREWKTTMASHVCAVRTAIYLISLLFKHDLPHPRPHEDIDEAWEMPLNEIEHRMRQLTQQPRILTSDRSTDFFFGVDDLTLRELQRIGQLRIHWTSYWDEHLKLDVNGKHDVLYLYWFHPSLSKYFPETGLCGKLTEPERLDRVQEITRTMSFVLSSKSGSQEPKHYYESLGAPEWLVVLASSEPQPWTTRPQISVSPSLLPPLSRYLLNHNDGSNGYCYDIQFHMSLVSADGEKRPGAKLSFSGFPFYEHRLRELRAYMDSQQPKGLRALWRDKRNSYAFYTFWLVILFGGLSLSIGLASLASSIVQALAQLQSN